MLFLLFLSLFVQASGVSIGELRPQKPLTSNADKATRPQKPLTSNADKATKVLKPQKNLTNIKNMIGELADADPSDVATLYASLTSMMDLAQAAVVELQASLDGAVNAKDLATVNHNEAISAHLATLTILEAAKIAQEEADRKVIEAQGVVNDAQAARAIALSELEVAEKGHTDAQNYFNTENPRLETEISTIEQMFVYHASLNGDSHKVVVGRPTAITTAGLCREASGDCSTGLAKDTEVHPVTCCSDTLISGWSNLCGNTDVYGERDVWAEGCQSLNWADANLFCSSKGGRLCTTEEVGSSCVGGYGCSFDFFLVWTSSQ